MYAEDYNDYIILYALSKCWVDLWSPYATDIHKISVCPSWRPYQYTESRYTYGVRIKDLSTSIHKYYIASGASAHDYVCLFIKNIKNPSLYWFMADSIRDNAKDGIPIQRGSQANFITRSENDLIKAHFRHSGATINLLFVDGHVESATKSRFSYCTQKGDAPATNFWWAINEKHEREDILKY